MTGLSVGGFALDSFILASKCFSVPSFLCWGVEVTVNVLNGTRPTWEEKAFLGPQR